MSEAEECRLKSEAYLREVAKTEDLGERARLISAAAYWNEQARVAEARHRIAARRGPP